eukprot:m.98989 g.98989  ORF g.98989 m.98989 type:complete len:221 (+) comp15090_c0_seq1:943-1605(+)
MPHAALHVQLIHPKKVGRSKYKNSGELTFTTTLAKSHSFLDYLKGGFQVNFSLAVDFTGSNGEPTDPGSLHYINPMQPNEYQQAIQAVGTIIADYDSDKQFPCMGFGAKLPDGSVSHEFALNGNSSNPFCMGVEGMLAAYAQAISTVQLWGPTNFSPIINSVAKYARQAKTGYYTLLIVTDGAITDMALTKQAIVEVSEVLLSLLFEQLHLHVSRQACFL